MEISLFSQKLNKFIVHFSICLIQKKENCRSETKIIIDKKAICKGNFKNLSISSILLKVNLNNNYLIKSFAISQKGLVSSHNVAVNIFEIFRKKISISTARRWMIKTGLLNFNILNMF